MSSEQLFPRPRLVLPVEVDEEIPYTVDSSILDQSWCQTEQERLADHVVETLNRLFEMDKQAIQQLFGMRVQVNEQLANHPTVQVTQKDDTCYLRVLGLINGLIGVDENNCGLVAAIYDTETNELLGFSRFQKK